MRRSFEQDLQTLGISVQDALAKVPDSDPDVWTKRTAAFHEMVRSARKTQCKKWHPDVCADPQAAEKTAEINAAADGLLTVRFKPRTAPVMQVFRVSFGWGGFWGGGTSTSTTTWTTGF